MQMFSFTMGVKTKITNLKMVTIINHIKMKSILRTKFHPQLLWMEFGTQN